MSGAASRNRGARGERSAVNWFRGHGFPDARRFLAGDGRQPGDVGGGIRVDVSRPTSVEVKNVREYHLAAWWSQAVAEAPQGHMPIVVFRPAKVAEDDFGNWWVLTSVNELFNQGATTNDA